MELNILCFMHKHLVVHAQSWHFGHVKGLGTKGTIRPPCTVLTPLHTFIKGVPEPSSLWPQNISSLPGNGMRHYFTSESQIHLTESSTFGVKRGYWLLPRMRKKLIDHFENSRTVAGAYFARILKKLYAATLNKKSYKSCWQVAVLLLHDNDKAIKSGVSGCPPRECFSKSQYLFVNKCIVANKCIVTNCSSFLTEFSSFYCAA